MRKSIRSLSSLSRKVLGGALLSGVMALSGCSPEGSDGDVEAQAQALGTVSLARSVYFSTMAINDCNEIGSCDWLLDCQLGDGQSFRLVNNYEADSGDVISIGRSVRDSYGTRHVACTAYEHDGGIGAGWDLVGHAEINGSSAGWYSMRMRNGEGDVTVRVYLY